MFLFIYIYIFIYTQYVCIHIRTYDATYIYIYMLFATASSIPCQVTSYRGLGSMPQGTILFTAVAMRGEKSPIV